MIERVRRRDLVVGAALFLLALAVFWLSDPVNHRLESDPSYMLYAGQQILRGKPPYVGVTIVKTPLTALLAAGAIAAGRAVGLNDVLAARIGFLLLAALFVGVIYLYSARLWARWAGVFAALTLVTFEMLGRTIAEGPAPKLVFLFFGMTALWLTLQRQWIWAGVAAALSFLAWQPGLLFVAAAGLGALLAFDQPNQPASPGTRASKYAPRLKSLGLVLIGALAPVLLVVIYLALGNALDAGIRQTLFANVSYFDAARAERGWWSAMTSNGLHLVRIAPRCLGDDEAVLAVRVLGLIGFGAAGLWYWLRRRQSDLLLKSAPLLFSLLVIGGFTLLDLQSCPDLLPFVPFVALGTGWLVWQLVALAQAFLTPRGTAARALAAALPVVLALIVFGHGISNLRAAPPKPEFLAQQQMAANINRFLGPHDRLQQFGDAVALILLQRENATRYIHLGHKQGEGVLRAEGFVPQELPGLLAQAQPKVITLSRAKQRAWAKPLYDFLETHYRLVESFDAAAGGTPQITDVYVRK